MRRALLVSGVAVLLACGDGEPTSPREAVEPAAADEPNRPPHVEALSISPVPPTAEDGITANLRVYDPDRDALSVELTWYRNGAVHDASGRQSIDPGEFERGDRIWVSAVVRDGSHELEVSSEPVVIANALPRADAIRITPPEPSAADILEVELQGGDADGDPVQWSYRWLVDGTPVPDAQTARLAPGKARRGASVVVEVSGNDGSDDGEWVASAPVRVANAAPQIVSQPVYGLASPGRYAYEVKAEDPDGDAPLRYALGEAPPGMSIDGASGAISWVVPSDAQGSYPVEIQVSDAHGGQTAQRYALQVSWKPAEDTERGEAPASGSEDGESEDGESEEAAASGSEDAFDDDAEEAPEDTDF